jgi:ABC-type transport system involved in multi-copper enzyme maturation permease subunit
MFWTLCLKELRSILVSPKFVLSFAIGAVLILLSVGIGIREYKGAMRQYETGVTMTEEGLRDQSSWDHVQSRAFRRPDPMQIFVSGVQDDIGRYSPIAPMQTVKLMHSAYSDDPIFALFRMCDLAFIIQVVFSLLAILFTYDAVCGEKEDGTLRLVLSHSVSRAQVLAAKGLGSWLGLVLPLSLPLALAVLLVPLSGVPMEPEHWLRLGLLLGASLLCFTFFMALGLFVSTLAHRGSHAFLGALVAWVVLVLIIPRAGMVLAVQLVPTPSAGEIDGRVAAFSKDQMNEQMQEIARQAEAAANNNQSTWSSPHNPMDEMRQKVDEYAGRLREDLRGRRQVQERLALSLARISPAAAIQLAAMDLAESDVELKSRCEEAMSAYRRTFLDFLQKKQQETGSSGGMAVKFCSKEGLSFSRPREAATIDPSQLPRYTPPRRGLVRPLVASAVDFGWMGLASVLLFDGAFLRFVRYDVR